MSETKHTPGPWRISGESATTVQADYRAINTEGGVLIASACGYPNSGYFPSDDEATANAALIAAAPELLEALNDAPVPSKYHGIRGFETNRFLSDYEAWMKNRRAAIAKAKGEQP